jgi:hypothetical protein
MTPKDLANDLTFLRAQGLRSHDFTRLHHFSLSGRPVSLTDAIGYFEAKTSMRGQNLSLAERCHYVAEQVRAGRAGLSGLVSEALAKWPLGEAGSPSLSMAHLAPRKPSVPQRGDAKQLGDAGESLATTLLTQRGYRATLLSPNYPTYDLLVAAQGQEFFVSVKVARKRQHLRLGSRRSVEQLTSGNFVFAFLPRDSEEVDLASSDYRLLILPASEVREYALNVHDTYWAAKGRADGFSVMVKAYDPRHATQWQSWSRYEFAWHVLPPPEQ